MTKYLPVLVALVYITIAVVCACSAARQHAWALCAIAGMGALAAIAALVLRAAGAWSDPKPWDEGDGE